LNKNNNSEFCLKIRTTFARTHLFSHPKAREAREAIATEARVVFLYITKVVSRPNPRHKLLATPPLVYDLSGIGKSKACFGG